MYFLAEFTYKKPCTMIVLDENGEICGREILPNVKGKFGPGVIMQKEKENGSTKSHDKG